MSVSLGTATSEDAGAVVDLLNCRLPAFWMRKVPQSDLRRFAAYAIGSRHSVLLLARPHAGGERPAGYIMAVFDARPFWLGLALRHPGLARRVAVQRLRRGFERGREIERKARQDEGVRALAPFSWSPSAPDAARIIGLFVRPEHRRHGIALDLYAGLFDALKRRGVAKVEEYMGPDYLQFAGRSTEACGWQVQKCRCEGFKLTKVL